MIEPINSKLSGLNRPLDFPKMNILLSHVTRFIGKGNALLFFNKFVSSLGPYWKGLEKVVSVILGFSHTGSISDIFMGFEFEKDQTEINFEKLL